ncbi:putative nitric oxide synthase isoform X1 [Nicotiana tabacum]|uniref:Nitric oxide synthase isoform X1 n=1 Tax=Nicotiana tabacum TaxID=4097 RepID=A0A1S3ZDS5_TOBAC|nr:PREDICTED: putative nitric oxide synthase isoform X1 [Nicotiana tabacum]
MAPKLLALSSLSSISPFRLPNCHISTPNCTPSKLNIFKFHTPKPNLILCKFTESQAVSESEPEGYGAAAPTRGDIYLQRQQAVAASSTVLATTKKKKKKKDKIFKVSNLAPCCYGCGAPLHTSEVDAPGYVDQETYDLKKKHHQLRKVLCGRCRLLSHGHMITAVGGNGGYSGGKQFVTAEELREKLSHLRNEKALIVKLVDIVDFNGSFLARVRDLAGANPIILVITKVDLLPKETDLNCVGDWVVEATMKKKLNVLSVHLTSSKSLVGIAGVVSEIQKEKKGRDVYILGSANVGKSAFINALLNTMSYNDPVAATARKYKPIQSAVPGTTLGPIPIDAFLGGGKVYDTPGVHLHHRQAAVIHAEDLPTLAPQSRLRGQAFPSSGLNLESLIADRVRSSGLSGLSIFWGGLVRIDVLKVLPETCLTFYGPKALQLHMVPTEEADEFYQKELGILLTPPTGKEKADGWMGLETKRQLQIKYEDIERPTCDVAISGLGWFSVIPVNKSVGTSDPISEVTAGELTFAVHVPKPVEIFVRPPLPIGKAGGQWYDYRELTEEESEVRPKWFF